MKCAVDYERRRKRAIDSYHEMANAYCTFICYTVRNAFVHSGVSGKRFDKADEVMYCEFGALMEKYAGDGDSDKEKIITASVAILQELKRAKIDLDKYQINVVDHFFDFHRSPDWKTRQKHARRREFLEEYCRDTTKAMTALYIKWLHDEMGFGAQRIDRVANEIMTRVSEYLMLYIQCTDYGDRRCKEMSEGKA